MKIQEQFLVCARTKRCRVSFGFQCNGYFYLIHRQLHSIDLAYKALADVLEIAKVLTVTNDDARSIYMQKVPNLEDCLLATCAQANKCDAIITRNKKEFLTFGIALLSPEELSELYQK